MASDEQVPVEEAINSYLKEAAGYLGLSKVGSAGVFVGMAGVGAIVHVGNAINNVAEQLKIHNERRAL
jgi:hypothetical protein